MPNVQTTQGASKAPPIPTMDVTPPPPATGREIARSVRDAARQAKTAAQQAARDARDASKAAPAIAGGAGQIATTAPPPFNPNDMIPPQVWDVTIAFFVTVAFCVVGFPIARALGRRLDRKTDFKQVAAADLTPHIRQLQDSVDAMAIEIERISEGQRFTAKLLAERSGAAQK